MNMKPAKPRGGGKIDFAIPEMFPLIENGAKYVTIRKHRKNNLQVGGILKVYLGNRFQGEQRYLGTAEILALEDVWFTPNRMFPTCRDNLHIKDGFNNRDEFIDYHRKSASRDDETVHKQIITFGNQSWLN